MTIFGRARAKLGNLRRWLIKLARLNNSVMVSRVGASNDISAFRDARVPAVSHSTAQVEQYYETNTQAYVRGFGEIFQGSRPESSQDLVDYLIKAADLADGQHVLDAGCGVCGPAIAFAQKLDVKIDAVTLSEQQVAEAHERIEAAGLQQRISVQRGDFHNLAATFGDRKFDRILFLESLCHAENYHEALEGAARLLAPGGKLYIKDFYAVDHRSTPERMAAQAADLQRLTDIYQLAVPDLASQIDVVGALGFRMIFVRRPEYESTYSHWAKYEAEVGRPWSPSSGQPGEVIQAFELLADRDAG